MSDERPSGGWSADMKPTRDDLVDAGFLLVLGFLALVGFRSTYSGMQYLIVGMTGLVLGIVVAHIANVLRQPVVVVVVLGVAVFFLLGAALAVRTEALGGFLPSVQSTRELADASVHGWKELLTTLPPVGSGGRLLVIPYILGLVAGVGGFAMARRLKSVSLPVIAPVAALIAVILLGTDEPAAKLLQGAVFGIVALGWCTVRGARVRPPLQNAVGHRSRMVTAIALIGVTFVAAAVIGPALPAGGQDRVVLRDYVEPPFDINRFPSPLVGFRKYTEPSKDKWDQVLFTVDGLPRGSYVRIATLDTYDGAVWGATSGTTPTGTGEPANAFVRVGSEIESDAEGERVTLHVKIADSYESEPDVNAWMPTAGAVEKVTFLGPNADAYQESWVYNGATRHGVVPDTLKAGDAYEIETVIGAQDRAEARRPRDDALPYGPPTLGSDAYSFTASQATEWSKGADGPVAKAMAIADQLVARGAYSDGDASKGQSGYWAGHSVARLGERFIADSQQPVGNDEQYAAAFALMANQVGVPARVVLGAEPGPGGVVRGQDVHTWVELHLADGTWYPIPRSVFMPPTDKAPDERLPETVSEANPSVVPPPNPVRPRSALEQQDDDRSDATALSDAAGGSGFQIPGFVIATIKVTLPPALVIGAFCAVVIGLKVRRRARRRTTGAPSERVAGGWLEITDYARDLGAAVPARATRREAAAVLADYPVAPLAAAADATVFGPDTPTDEHAEQYWATVEDTRKEMVSGLTRWQRIRAELSLRSLRRPGRAGRGAAA